MQVRIGALKPGALDHRLVAGIPDELPVAGEMFVPAPVLVVMGMLLQALI